MTTVRVITWWGAMLAVLLVLAFPAAPAGACSCVEPDAEEFLDGADAAFVGSAVTRRASGQEAVVTFRVDGVAKGDLPSQIEVATSADEAACGLPVGVGTTAVFLQGSDGDWSSGLCSVMPAFDLESIADLHPPDPVVPPTEGARTAALAGGVGRLGSALGPTALLALLGLAVAGGGVLAARRRHA